MGLWVQAFWTNSKVTLRTGPISGFEAQHQPSVLTQHATNRYRSAIKLSNHEAVIEAKYVM